MKLHTAFQAIDGFLVSRLTGASLAAAIVRRARLARLARLVGLAILALGTPLRVGAERGWQNDVPNGSVDTCDLCHGDSRSFRNDYSAAGRRWTRGLAEKDSDNDGFSNGWELQDPMGVWTKGDPDPGDAALVRNPSARGDAPPLPVEVQPAMVSHVEPAGENGEEPLAVRNIGGAAFDWTLIPSQSWMAPDPGSETALPPAMEDLVLLLFTTDGLEPGDYAGTLTLEVPGIDSAQIPGIPVSLSVPEPRATGLAIAAAGALAALWRRRASAAP